MKDTTNIIDCQKLSRPAVLVRVQHEITVRLSGSLGKYEERLQSRATPGQDKNQV